MGGTRGTSVMGSIGWFVDHATALLALGGLLLVLLAIVVVGINPVTVLHKAADGYDEYEARQELVEDHVELGDKLLDVEQAAAARAEFEAALELDDTNTAASLGLFKTRLFEPLDGDRFDPEVAERRLAHLVQTHPEDAHAHAYLADTLLRLGAYDDALREYREAVAIDPELAHGYSGQALVFDLRGRPSRALDHYARALEVSPHSPRYRNNYAYQLYRVGRYDDAIAQYEAVLALDPTFMLSYYVLGAAHRLAGRPGRARDVHRTLLALLADKRVRGLARNAGAWFFHVIPAEAKARRGVGPRAVMNLVDLRQKRAYAHLSMALTNALLADEAGMRSELAAARRVPLDATEIAAPLTIVRFDVLQLGTRRPRYLERLARFDAALDRVGPPAPR
jgi:tetratricopeptide (TPR) repeat protein